MRDNDHKAGAAYKIRGIVMALATEGSAAAGWPCETSLLPEDQS